MSAGVQTGAGAPPSGLTALAVLNFVGGGLLGLYALLSWFDFLHGDAVGPVGKLGRTQPSLGDIYLHIGILTGVAVLLIVSGIGYLKQRRGLGRVVGNLYALLSLAASVFSLLGLHHGVDVVMLAGFVYPVVTLALINVTFRRDFR